MGVVIGLFNEQSKNVTIVEGNIKISYDNTNKMLSTYEKLYANGYPIFRTVVVDYNKNAKYVINDGDSFCNKTLPDEWTFNCFPENSTDGNVIMVGFGDNMVTAKNYHVVDPKT